MPRNGQEQALLSIRHVRKEYRPGEPVLKDITLDIDAHGVTAIIGPSGTGKSTLIRCINRLVNPTAGEIWLGGRISPVLKAMPCGWRGGGSAWCFRSIIWLNA